MLQPKRVRYRRPQDGRGNKGNAHRGTTLAFGSFGIKTLDAKWIDSRQIEAARVANGFASSRTNPSLASLLMYVWVKVRVTPQDGWLPLLRVVSSLRSRVFLLRLPRRLCVSVLRSCP